MKRKEPSHVCRTGREDGRRKKNKTGIIIITTTTKKNNDSVRMITIIRGSRRWEIRIVRTVIIIMYTIVRRVSTYTRVRTSVPGNLRSPTTDNYVFVVFVFFFPSIFFFVFSDCWTLLPGFGGYHRGVGPIPTSARNPAAADTSPVHCPSSVSETSPRNVCTLFRDLSPKYNTSRGPPSCVY